MSESRHKKEKTRTHDGYLLRKSYSLLSWILDSISFLSISSILDSIFLDIFDILRSLTFISFSIFNIRSIFVCNWYSAISIRLAAACNYELGGHKLMDESTSHLEVQLLHVMEIRQYLTYRKRYESLRDYIMPRVQHQ